MRPPLAIVACLMRGVCRVFRLRDPLPPVNWHETFTDMAARFFLGLLAGGGICLLLWPALFWPGTRSGRSILEQLGWSDRGGWILLAVLIGAALFAALSTRVKWLGAEWADAAWAASHESDLDARVKTGCMGILLPLCAAAYGIYYIVHPRKLNRFGQLHEPEFVVSLGIVALGIAVFVHALGFVPYERIPLLKWLVAAAGVGVFIYGLTWSHIR